MIYAYQSFAPILAPDVFVAPSADVIGNVRIGQGSGVWFQCLVRGDVDSISIGEFTNLQDHCVVHVTGGRFSTSIGSHCSLGHRATVHGAILRDHAFVGIGATVMDGCEMGEFSLLAAGSLLPPGKSIPDGMLAMGSPARVLRPISDDERAMILRVAETYARLAREYRGSDLRPMASTRP